MATIRIRGGEFQAILRQGHHSQAKTFSKRADAEHWAKRLEIDIERNVAALPNSVDGITFGELTQSYKKRGIGSQIGFSVCWRRSLTTTDKITNQQKGYNRLFHNFPNKYRNQQI